MWMALTCPSARLFVIVTPGYCSGRQTILSERSSMVLPAELRQWLHHSFVARLVEEGHRHTRCARNCVEDAVQGRRIQPIGQDLHSTAQHSTSQHSTAQHSAAQHISGVANHNGSLYSVGLPMPGCPCLLVKATRQLCQYTARPLQSSMLVDVLQLCL
jgi:hypothetical protein